MATDPRSTYLQVGYRADAVEVVVWHVVHKLKRSLHASALGLRWKTIDSHRALRQSVHESLWQMARLMNSSMTILSQSMWCFNIFQIVREEISWFLQATGSIRSHLRFGEKAGCWPKVLPKNWAKYVSLLAVSAPNLATKYSFRSITLRSAKSSSWSF